MNEIVSAIRDRRSVRKFQDQDIPENVLQQVLDAVRWSPSWANTQCWEIIVIKDQSTQMKLQATIMPKNPATKSMIEAPVLIAVCGKIKQSGYYKDQPTTKLGDWFMFDLGLATQNLCLSAHSLGLGTVIVGSFNHDEASKILHVPEGVALVAFVPMGYPAKTPQAPTRRAIDEFVHIEKF